MLRTIVPGIILSFAALFPVGAVPPLRIAVPAAGEGLHAAGQWSSLARKTTMESTIQVAIVEDDLAALALLQSRDAEVVVLDPVSYLSYGPGLSIVAIMEYYGEPYTRFSLIVPGSSIFHRLPDLNSPRVAFRGPSSGIARTYTYAWAHTLGAFPAGIREEILLDSFESVIRAVALGEVDAGFVPTAFMETLRGSVLLEKVRELASSPRIPLALLVYRDDLNPQRKELVQYCARKMEETGTPGFVIVPGDSLTGILASMVETLSAAAH